MNAYQKTIAMKRRKTHGYRCACIESLESRRLLSVPGSLDPTFSGNGLATFGVFGLSASDVAVQADGKAVVAGTRTDSGGNVDLALARYTVDGQPDTSFGNQGLVVVPLLNLSDERIHAVTIAPDGKIVVTGSVEAGSIGFVEDELLVYRFTSSGAVDTTFSDNGGVQIDLGNFSGGTR